MSRSALLRQEAGVKEREREATEIFSEAVAEGRQNQRSKGIVPLYGPDDTFNINAILLQSIILSPYFSKCCQEINDWNSLVDEIYYEVKHVEPWVAGSKSPSSAFCLLLRLLTLRCSDRQLQLMLDHKDSPYIRCIGFLYLRYAGRPDHLWSWISRYVVSDDEVFQVQASSSAAEMTMGEYICQLFGELEYYGTRLPRLPTDVERDLKVRLLHAKKVEDRAKHHAASVRSMDHFQRLGSKVRALYEDEQNPIRWYDAVIDRVISTDPETGEALKRPRFVVTFPEYGNTETVSLGEIDVVGGEGVGIERGGQWERGGRAGHDEQLGHNGNNNYQRRQYKDGYRRGCSDDQRKHGRDRNRSRSRSRDRGVDNKAGLLEEVLRREPQSTTTSGNKAYASRPPSTKASLSASFNNRKRASFEDDGEYQPMRQTLPTPVATTNQQPPPLDKLRREKTPEEIAAIAEKKRKLMDKYG